VRAALPAGDVRRDEDFRLAIFHLARHLKGHRELALKPASEVKQLVRDWHDLARPRIGGRSITKTWLQFASAWPAVRHAVGDDMVTLAWDKVQSQPPPPEANDYDDDRIGRLIALCRHLQAEHGGDRFFLSGYRVAELFEVTQPTAAKWFKMLEADGILEVVDPGGGFRGGRRQARSYRCREN
jgi:hypothetical protein